MIIGFYYLFVSSDYCKFNSVGKYKDVYFYFIWADSLRDLNPTRLLLDYIFLSVLLSISSLFYVNSIFNFSYWGFIITVLFTILGFIRFNDYNFFLAFIFGINVFYKLEFILLAYFDNVLLFFSNILFNKGFIYIIISNYQFYYISLFIL